MAIATRVIDVLGHEVSDTGWTLAMIDRREPDRLGGLRGPGSARARFGTGPTDQRWVATRSDGTSPTLRTLTGDRVTLSCRRSTCTNRAVRNREKLISLADRHAVAGGILVELIN